MAKYTPKTKDELKKLVADESIYLGDIDTSAITDMGSLFKGSKRQDFRGIEKWNTSNVVNMLAMFFDATTFNHNINSWNVSNVVDMAAMFFGATTFNQPLNKWDTSSVVNMYRMFTVATRFNQPLDNWDTSNVEFMTEMFSGALSFNQNLNSWDVSNVRDNREMFDGTDSLKKIPKWYKQRAIADINDKSIFAAEMNKRVNEAIANPRPKAKAKPQQSRAQSGNFDFWQGKNTIILVIVSLIIGVSIGFIKNMSKESNKAKSPPTQTTQPKQNKQFAQAMPRCDDSALLNHLIKTHKDNLIATFLQDDKYKDSEVFVRDAINQYKFNIMDIKAISNNVANKEITCQVEWETINPNLQNKPIYEIAVYRAQLKDDNSIGFEFLGYKNTNP